MDDLTLRVRRRAAKWRGKPDGFPEGFISPKEKDLPKEKWRIGDGTIEPQYVKLMRALAVTIDELLNSPLSERKNGFVLMVFPFENADGRCNYISNSDRDSIRLLMQEQIKNFEMKEPKKDE